MCQLRISCITNSTADVKQEAEASDHVTPYVVYNH